jgi:lycopene cyclase domain-containing protein
VDGVVGKHGSLLEVARRTGRVGATVLAGGSAFATPHADCRTGLVRVPTPVDRYQYLILMALCVLITLPLELVFHARVYRRPRRWLRALAVPVVLFVAWDMLAIARGDWSYAAAYTTGWLIPPNLPVEELVFFVVIPTCALLTFEALTWLRTRRRT